MSELARGLARGLTADWVGAPVDFATLLTNLGLAGGGFLAHQLGLIKTPPDLIDPRTVPFSSDWFAKNTILDDPGTAGYAAGRMVGNIAPGLPRAGAALASSTPKGQLNALYPGGRDDLLVSHATSRGALFPENQFRAELYNPSWGISKNSTMLGKFGDDVLVIPKAQKIDPKNAPSSVHAFDAFTPRHSDSVAKGGVGPLNFEKLDALRRDVDVARRELEFALKNRGPDDIAEAEQYLKYAVEKLNDALYLPDRELASKRLVDKFYPLFPKGGLQAEGITPSKQQFGSTALPVMSKSGMIEDSAFKLRQNINPRFTSFEHYEKSPYGAKLLDDVTPPKQVTGAVEMLLNEISKNLYFLQQGAATPEKLRYLDPTLIDPSGKLPVSPYNWVRGLANPKLLENKVQLVRDPRTDSIVRTLEPLQRDDAVPLSPQELAELSDKARRALEILKLTPSEYGEVKTWGAFPLTGSTTAGILVRGLGSTPEDQAIAALAAQRKIPLEFIPPTSSHWFPRAVELQNQGFKR